MNPDLNGLRGARVVWRLVNVVYGDFYDDFMDLVCSDVDMRVTFVTSPLRYVAVCVYDGWCPLGHRPYDLSCSSFSVRVS